MPSLTKIRENKEKNIKYKEKILLNYKNPFPISILAKIIKNQNKLYLENYAKEKNLNEKDIIELLDNFLKPNYYCPSIVQKKNREKLQCKNINNNVKI